MAERHLPHRRPLDPQARMRRRFARRQWAARLLSARRVLVVVGVAALAVLGAWVVWGSSLLAVSSVEVDGVSQLSAAEVQAAARVPVGEPLAGVDLDAVRMRVEALAGVASADVTRAWPHAVRIQVTERQAVAVVSIGGAIRGMDERGVVFRTYAHPPAGLPSVTTAAGTSAEALAEAAAVVTSLPSDIAARVDHVDVRTIDAISLVLRDGRTVLWGSSAQSDQKAEVLDALLAQPAQPARTIDVSVPSRPTTSG